MVACARLSRASGRPTCSTACAAATATSSARGSALPMSSEASTIIRRAMKRGSSPPSSIAALVVDERPFAGRILHVRLGERCPLGLGRAPRELEDVERVACVTAGAGRDQPDEIVGDLRLELGDASPDDQLELLLR